MESELSQSLPCRAQGLWGPVLALAVLFAAGTSVANAQHDTVIRNALIVDGSGNPPFFGEIAIDGDQITFVGSHVSSRGRIEIDAHRFVVAPGFINMLAHPEESLLVDGRALSDLKQGVTLEVMGEDSMGPLNSSMKEVGLQRQTDIHYPIDWSTLGEYLEKLEHLGISPNVASFVGAGTVRENVLGEADVQPSAAQLEQMRRLVQHAMEEGALGLTTALIYVPNTFVKTPELIELAKVSARCGGMYISHIRDEGDRLLEAIQETIDIARASGAPAEIYHFKQAGRDNWNKLEPAIALINRARKAGTRITADMYVYPASATGLDASMPPWVQAGGLEAWIARLKDPRIRERVVRDMQNAHPADWENALGVTGADGVLFLKFKNPRLKPLIGKTLGDVAKMRNVSPQDAAIDLVIEDGARVEVAYFQMSEVNVRREVTLPWMSFGSDAEAPAPEGKFLESSTHPRAYGNFARLLGKYVRDDKVLTLQEAVRRLTAFPASMLSLEKRGQLRKGYFADVVIFDPATIADHSTFADVHRLSTGVEDVWINGIRALEHGEATRAASGRFVRGRAWSGAAHGGCRQTAAAWRWNK